MNSASSNNLRGFEKLIWLLDEPPLDTLHRVAIGFGLLPLHAQVLGRDSAPWQLVLFVLLLLFVLKLGFGVLRSLLPVSAGLKAAWKERRVLGKSYDSYQWKKMLGFGPGMLAYLFWSGQASGFPLLFAALCTAAGVWGMIHWQGRKRVLAAQVSAAAAG
jgi:hypothetical protein